MLKLVGIVGNRRDRGLAGALHALEHGGGIETIVLGRHDMRRHRLRTVTDRGTDCAIALPRSLALEDGAVLLLEDDRAIVVRAAVERWLQVRPRDAEAALRLGYFAGNLHWRVDFRREVLAIALEGPEQTVLDRLRHFLDDGRARLVDG